MDNYMKHLDHIEAKLLVEIRENRKEIAKLNEKVMSNKIKLGMFITGLTLFCNVAFVYVLEKIKSNF